MIEILRQRRSIRKYKNKKIEGEKVKILREAAVRSPTSRNYMPWNFYFVENKKIIEELSTCKPHGALFLANAPLAIVVTGDENKSDVWIEDCSIASINLQLTAQTLGLGSCWIQVRKRFYNKDVPSGEYIRKFFDFGEKQQVLSIIAIGYPDEERSGLEERRLNYDAIHNF